MPAPRKPAEVKSDLDALRRDAKRIEILYPWSYNYGFSGTDGRDRRGDNAKGIQTSDTSDPTANAATNNERARRLTRDAEELVKEARKKMGEAFAKLSLVYASRDPHDEFDEDRRMKDGVGADGKPKFPRSISDERMAEIRAAKKRRGPGFGER